MKMASGGKLLHEGRTEKLLSRILPEVSSSTEDENDRNPSPPPFKVPDGLRSLLNELSKEVLNSQPKGHEALYSFCADYLDKRLEERENSESDDKVGDGKLSPTKGKQKSGFLRREGTFNLYSTDSDSGIESSTTAAFEDHLHGNRGAHSCDDDDESPPSLDTAIQRLAETIKEFDVHSGVSNGNGHDKNHVTHDFKAEEFFAKEKALTNGNNRVSSKNGNSKLLGKAGHANGNGQNGNGTKEKNDTNGNGTKLFGRNGNGKQPPAKDTKSEKSTTKEKAKTNGSICGTEPTAKKASRTLISQKATSSSLTSDFEEDQVPIKATKDDSSKGTEEASHDEYGGHVLQLEIMNLILDLGNDNEQGVSLGLGNSANDSKISNEIAKNVKEQLMTRINLLITKDGKVQKLPSTEQPKELNYSRVHHTTIPIHLHEKGQDADCSKHLNYNDSELEEEFDDIDRNALLTTPLHSIRSITSDLPASPLSIQLHQSESEDNINQENVNKKTFLKDKQLKTSLDASSRIKNEEKFELDHCTTGGSSKIISPIEVTLQLGRVSAETEDLNKITQSKMLQDIKSTNNGIITKEENVVKVHKTDSQMQTDFSPMLIFKEGKFDYDSEKITLTDEGKTPRNIETTPDNNSVTKNNNITSVIEGKVFSLTSTSIQTDETSLSDSTCQTDSHDQPTNNSIKEQQGREETCYSTAAHAVSKSIVGTQTVDLEVVQRAVQTDEEEHIEGEFTLTIKSNENNIDNEEGVVRKQESFERDLIYEHRRSETELLRRPKERKDSFGRTRTASPIGSRFVSSSRGYSPQVQDNVVARVLLEHAGSVCPPSDPRSINSRSVNYLDLSRLGEEGETPASDEIWLAVGSANGGGEEDKFLSSDDDTNTYSVATDKLSTAATLAGHVSAGHENDDPSSHADLLDDELGVLGRSSFDEEVQATTRIQTVLAGELIPLRHILDKARENIVDVNHKVDNMEGMLSTLNGTVTQLSSRVDPAYADQPNQSGENRPVSRGSNLAMSGQEITLLDQLVTRIESLSTNVTNVESTRQLKEDNLLLKKDLQQYRDRELHLLTRMEALERRLNQVQISGGLPPTEFVKTTELTPTPLGQSSVGRPKSRKGSESAEPVELPPIQVPDSNGRLNKVPSRSSSRKSRNRSGSKQSDTSSEESIKPNGHKQENLNGPPQKASLVPPGKGKKPSFIKPKSNGGSSSSEDNSGPPREKPPRSITPLETGGKCRPMTPEATADFLQSEIQVQRADNNILRQDIQVFRERESQLVMRNNNLESKLIEQSDAILDLTGRKGKKGSTAVEDLRLNVNFEDESTDEKEVFEQKSKAGKKINGKRAPSEDRKSSVDEKSTSKSSTASSKRGPSKGSSNRSSSRDTKKSSAESSGEEAKKAPTSTANGVPKTKQNGKLSKGPKSTAKQSQEVKTSEDEKVDRVEEKTGEIEKTEGKRKLGMGLFEGEDWKVTIESEHTLVTEQDTPRKTIVITPKPEEKEQEELIVDTEEEKKTEEVKQKRAVKLTKTKTRDPRYCPIPKPPQFPAARPPREYVPVKQVPNSSSGVSGTMGGNYLDSSNMPAAPRGRRISGGGGNGHSRLNVPPTSGRNSAASDRSDVIQMLIKQESRDSNVDAAPPICQDGSLHDIRESPDGANSSAIDATCKSSNGRASTSFDIDMTEEFGSTYDEEYCKDIIREFVQMEGQPPEQRSSCTSPFKKYTNKLKNKVIKDHIMTSRNSKENTPKSSGSNLRLLPDRPRQGLKPVSVSRTRSRMASKPSKYIKPRQNLKARSISCDNISPEKVNNLSEEKSSKDVQAFSTRHSVERLPTLSKFDEERIVWLKNLEDDIQFNDERRRKTVLSRQQMIESSPSTSPSTDPPSSDPSTCVSIDNSPNVARKGGLLTNKINETTHTNRLVNIRKDEIHLSNLSNVANGNTTDLCKHPNQSQLSSMDHELSANRPETRTQIANNGIGPTTNNESKHRDDNITRNDVDEEEDSLMDDKTYDIVDNKVINVLHNDSIEDNCKVEVSEDMMNKTWTKNEMMVQQCVPSEVKENNLNNNASIDLEGVEVGVAIKDNTESSNPIEPTTLKDITIQNVVPIASNTVNSPLETEQNNNATSNGKIGDDSSVIINDNEKNHGETEENITADQSMPIKRRRDTSKSRARKKNKEGKSQTRPELSAECFIVSRGWQMDQSKLCRALDKIKGVSFSRVQAATTINRVIESIRPHQDAVVIHICSQELMEAAQSIITVPNEFESGYSKHSQKGNLAMGLSVVQSIATVLGRHIFTAAGQNRSTQFIISLPLPMTLIPLLPPNYEITEKDVKNLGELRRSFNAHLKSTLCKSPNVQCCDNENLASTMATAALVNSVSLTSGSTPICNGETKSGDEKVEGHKLLNDNNQLTSAGMKKLARNWEIYLTMVSKGKEGQLILRRPSEESSSSNNSNSNNPDDLQNGGSRRMSSSGESAGSDRSIEGRKPWMPY